MDSTVLAVRPPPHPSPAAFDPGARLDPPAEDDLDVIVAYEMPDGEFGVDLRGV